MLIKIISKFKSILQLASDIINGNIAALYE